MPSTRIVTVAAASTHCPIPPEVTHIDLEQPVVRDILDDLPRGIALDAACGTGWALTHVPDLAPVVAEFAWLCRWHQLRGGESAADVLEIGR